MSAAALIGAFIITLALAFFVMNLVTAYRTAGGSIGQVPVMAFPVVLPLLALLGVGLIDRGSDGVDWPVWGYAACWLVTTLGAWWATLYAGNLGK